MITFEPVTPEAIQHIADNMRAADVVEVWASSRMTPQEALESSVHLSDYATVACADGVPLVIFGLIKGSLLSGQGIPWLLGTEYALKYKRHFLLQTPSVIDEMLTICPTLSNYVHSDNRVSMRWLRWLGFTIDEAEPIGKGGEMFHRFHMRKGECVTLH